MKSTAQVPCTCALPATPPTALVKRTNFAQALDHVPAAEAQRSLLDQRTSSTFSTIGGPLRHHSGGFICFCVRTLSLFSSAACFSRFSGSAAHVSVVLAYVFGVACACACPSRAEASCKSHNFTCQGQAPSETDVTSEDPNKAPLLPGPPILLRLPSVCHSYKVLQVPKETCRPGSSPNCLIVPSERVRCSPAIVIQSTPQLPCGLRRIDSINRLQSARCSTYETSATRFPRPGIPSTRQRSAAPLMLLSSSATTEPWLARPSMSALASFRSCARTRRRSNSESMAPSSTIP